MLPIIARPSSITALPSSITARTNPSFRYALTVLLLVLPLLSLAAQEQPIGGQRDEHGCLSAAGQTWSRLRRSCIQLFNEATRLDPVTQRKDETLISAFVLLNPSRTKAELFLPSGKSSLLLAHSMKHSYRKGKYRYDAASGILYIGKRAAYRKARESSVADPAAHPAVDPAQQVLLVYYDPAVGSAPLLKAIEERGATLIYKYEHINGVAVSVPKSDADAAAHFRKVAGVLSVERDRVVQLH